jgi:hypothetical protein
MANIPRNDPDVDALFAEPSEASKTMNALIKSGASKGVTFGSMAERESGVPDPEAARERLSAAISEVESAKRRGDVIDQEDAEKRLDELIDESRASRGAQPRDDQGRYAGSGYDGGVRGTGGPRPRPGGNRTQETSTQLFKRAVEANRAEAGRPGDDGTISGRVIKSGTFPFNPGRLP